MKKHVFVSYSHVDHTFAELLKSKLAEVGIDAWLDHDRLRAGDDWREGIDTAIKSSFAMIVVMSPESDKSKYVTYEWAYAYGIGIRILPIMHRQTALHPRLEAMQYEDFTRMDPPWDRLIQRLKEWQNADQPTEQNEAPGINQLRGAISALSHWNPREREDSAKVLEAI